MYSFKRLKMKIGFDVNTGIILLSSSSIIIIITLTSFSSDLDQKDGKFAIAQAQTSATFNLETLGTPLYHSNSVKMISQRVIDTEEIPKIEVSIIGKGTMAGIGNVTNIGTFIETYKTNKIIFGEGKGMITAGNGSNNSISWKSYDVGKINSDKSENYHGIMFFIGNNSSSNGSLRFLDNTAALYTSSVDTNGSTVRQIWQWK